MSDGTLRTVIVDAQCPSDDVFAAVAERRLSSDLESEFRTHVDHCSPCRRHWSDLIGTLSVGPEEEPGEPTLPAGSTFAKGRFERIRPLGEGGMGVVWLVRDRRLDRDVALKAYRRCTRSPAFDSELLIAEARRMARVNSPHVVSIFDAGLDDGTPYVAMEYVDGLTFDVWRNVEPRSLDELLQALAHVAEGLADLHAAGLVHRDVKPQNILCAFDGRVLVSDLGLATAFDADEPAREGAAACRFIGTVGYAPPEQSHGVVSSPRSDTYSLCCVLFEALYGTRPTAPSPKIPTRSGNRHVPRRVRLLLRQGLAADPQARPGDLRQLARRLRPPAVSRSWLFLVAVPVAALAGVAVVRPADTCTDVGNAMSRVWHPQRRASVHAALAAVEAKRWEETVVLVDRRLDGYAARWSDLRTQACRRDPSSGDGSEHFWQACLDRHLARFDRLLGALEGPDADNHTLSAATPAIDRERQALESCISTPSEYSAFADASSDEGAPQPRAVALDALEVDYSLARYEKVAAHADALLSVDTSAAPHLDGRWALLVARALQDLGRYDDAERLLARAVQHAAAANDHTTEAEAWIHRVFVAGYRRKVPVQELDERLLAAQAGVSRAGNRRRHRAMLAIAYGAGRLAGGDSETAATQARNAIALLERGETYEGDELAAAYVLAGSSAMALSDPVQAASDFSAAHGVMTLRHGPRHPKTASMLGNIGAAALAAGQDARAQEILREALEHEFVARGSVAHANLLNNLGLAQRRLGQLDDAEQSARAALRALRLVQVPAEVAKVHLNLSETLLAQGRRDAALEQVEIARDLLGDDPRHQTLREVVAARIETLPRSD